MYYALAGLGGFVLAWVLCSIMVGRRLRVLVMGARVQTRAMKVYWAAGEQVYGALQTALVAVPDEVKPHLLGELDKIQTEETRTVIEAWRSRFVKDDGKMAEDGSEIASDVGKMA